MAVIIDDSMTNAMVKWLTQGDGRYSTSGFWASTNITYGAGTNVIHVFSGTMPVDLTTIDLTAPTNELVKFEFTTATTIDTDTTSATVNTATITAGLQATAVGTGTASWALLYRTYLESTRLERAGVPVTDGTGNGVVILDTVNITSGNTITLMDFGFRVRTL